MPLVVVGLNHRTAPIEVRERFVFPRREAQATLGRLTAGGLIEEAVLLSTCNRTELYFRIGTRDIPEANPGTAHGDSADAATEAGAPAPGAVPGAGADPATEAGARAPGGMSGVPGGEANLEAAALAAAVGELCRRAGMTREEAERHLYVHRGGEAVATHLFRVSTSLDSMVLGEAQIQGQVKEAYEDAASAMSAVVGPVLSRLFQTALSVGGRVRNETELAVGAASVPSAAVELGKKIFGSLRGRRALVMGAGEMSELALEALLAEGVSEPVVMSRTEARAAALAVRAGARPAGYHELPELLGRIDVITAATASPHPVLTRSLLDRALPRGRRGPLLIVDIALPRDVEPAVGSAENVFLYDLDDLRQIVEDNLERRRDEIPAAERLIREHAAEFRRWHESLEVVPVIRALRGRAESLRRAEVEKALRKLAHLPPEDREVVEVLTRQLMNKVLHGPTVRLRDAASNGTGVAVVEALRYLFELSPAVEREPDE